MHPTPSILTPPCFETEAFSVHEVAFLAIRKVATMEEIRLRYPKMDLQNSLRTLTFQLYPSRKNIMTSLMRFIPLGSAAGMLCSVFPGQRLQK
jgi:hypothetical protein